jgi:hypothetical protein
VLLIRLAAHADGVGKAREREQRPADEQIASKKDALVKAASDEERPVAEAEDLGEEDQQ